MRSGGESAAGPGASRRIGAIAGAWSDLVAHRPKTVGVLVAAMTLALAWPARQFHIDASPDSLLTPDNEHYLQTRLVDQRFSTEETLIIAYQPTGHPLLGPETFDDLRGLSHELAALPRVESVRSLLNVPLSGGGGGASADGLTALQSLDDTTEAERPSYAELSRTLHGHPIYEGLLIDPEQTVTALQVSFRPDSKLDALDREMLAIERKSLQGDLSDAQQDNLAALHRQAEPLQRALSQTRDREIKTIRRIVDAYEDDANLYIGGIHALEHGLIRIIEHDVLVFGGAIAVAIIVILLVLFRSLAWTLVPVVCCAVSLTSTIGLFVLAGLETTVISANFVALQLILTLAVAIHLIVEYRQLAAERPRADTVALLRSTMERKTRPCVYAGITTSVGFGSLLISGIQPVISFGWMMVIAMAMSLIVTLTLFPALVAMLRPARPARSDGRWAGALLDRLAGVAVGRPRTVLGISVAVLLWGCSGAFLLNLENSFLSYFGKSTELRRDLAFIDRHLGGTTPLDVVYTVPPSEREPDLVMTAETVQRLQRIQDRLERHPAIGKVLSVTSFTHLARRLNGNRPLTETELTAAYRLIPEGVRNDLIGGFFDPEHHQVRFSARIKDTTPNLDRGALLEAIRGDLASLGIGPDQYQLTNLAVLYEDILDRLFSSQVETLLLVVVALAAAFWISFRSLRIALIALVPNVLATTAVFGIMGWAGIELDVMTITIAAITIGIAVDDTIHYVHRYRDARADGSAADAARTTHRTVGFAVLYTTVIITLGFSLLTFSEFVPSVLFGALTGAAMVVALLADLTLLPVLLARFGTAGHHDATAHESHDPGRDCHAAGNIDSL